MVHRFSSLSKYTAHSTTIIFFCGFIFDMFLLPDINDSLSKFIGGGYLLIVAFLIFFREWLVSRNTATSFEHRMYSVATFGIAYFSGSALSFVFVYALRSADFSVSWPLFLMLGISIYANEFVATHNFRLSLDVGVLFLAFLFYMIFNLPAILKIENDTIFGLSIVVVIALSLLYVYILKSSSEGAQDESPRFYALALGIPMFVSMFYFLNVLPAVPLSIKESGIYHAVTHVSSGEFFASGEEDKRFLKKFRTGVYHLTPQDTGIYFFSAVDAPAELSAPLSHVWEYYDEKNSRWVTSTTVSFTINGGREDGYRAYSKKENISEGLWRVTVKVDGNRVVGRVKFIVKKEPTVELVNTKL